MGPRLIGFVASLVAVVLALVALFIKNNNDGPPPPGKNAG